MDRLLVILFCLLYCASAVAAEAPIRVEPGDDLLRPRFVTIAPAGGAGEGGQLRLARLDDKTGEPGPAVFGTVQRTGETIAFQPEFHLSPGGRYRATLTIAGKPPISIDYTAPAAPDEKPATVERVYPTSDKLPANLLKFYVYFSQPMRQSDKIFDRMHILNEKGQAVHDPWRRFQQWSEDGKRLTLWIHPGRVKQGVNLREEFGPVLMPGQKFTLKLEATLEDLSGKPMAAAFEKTFTATAEDRERIAVEAWQLTAIRAGSRDPLKVTFPKPLDHALLSRLLTVGDAAGRAIDGKVDVGEGESSWAFTPASPWNGEGYQLVADELLEDLAGNTPVRVFDAEMGKAGSSPVTRRAFEPRP
ncbi:hypothetical protein [Humisphaera borealis]|uniref:Uncharacterized protein n=1 Tax=Humisphaera borealis TaxID=2807512 RepID=A0A7M2WRW8_9BACT|nr:hypothetical protein [Humisphaera borealis]QOV88014.1 hypothetical protein IPV69_17300 [Humisphaera borealis]